MNDVRVAPGSTWDRVRAALTSLHPGQRRVAEVLLAMAPSELGRASASDIAVRSDTSPATVVRTCQHLGFSGFRDCAVRLALESSNTGGAGVPAADREDPSVRFLRDAAGALEHAATTLDGEMLASVAAEIAGARRTLVTAYGWSLGAASTFALHLAALGCVADAPPDAQTQLVAATHLKPGDVCVVVCYTGTNPHSQAVAKLAKASGARVILVSTFSHSLTAAWCDANLIFAGREAGERFSDLPTAAVVQLAVLEALRIAVAGVLGQPAQDAVRAALDALVIGALFAQPQE